MIARIHRIYESQCTIGMLSIDDEVIGFTLEKKWLDNTKGMSCIPCGTYKCSRRKSPKYGEVFEVLDVPNRTDILFHPANYESQLKGCIAVGLYVGYADKTRMLKESKKGFNAFMDKLKGVKSFELIIS